MADNPALSAAREQAEVVACFVVSEAQWRSHDVGDRRLAFLNRCVQALAVELAQLGIPLRVLHVPWFRDVPEALIALLRREQCAHLHFNAEYPLNELNRDRAVARRCSREAIGWTRHHGSVVHAPGSLTTGSGGAYSVFTPFRNRWLAALAPGMLDPLPVPWAQASGPAAVSVDWPLNVEDDCAEDWPGGERQAQRRLHDFLDAHAGDYGEQRDYPGVPGTSRLSAYLSVGALSPRQCLHALTRREPIEESSFATELIWREFYRHVVVAFPHVCRGEAFHRQYDSVRWEHAPDQLAAWQAGETGYPLVDAGMRQLRTTGWMHNRLRMVTAMFLSKHLLIDWREGERYFMQQLVDGDFAANNGGWQWSASTGTDAAPYFRIFNPASQGQRFDAKGVFTRQWVPELAAVPDKWLFEPWKAGGVTGYPSPVVEHAFARQRAIERFRGVGDAGTAGNKRA